MDYVNKRRISNKGKLQEMVQGSDGVPCKSNLREFTQLSITLLPISNDKNNKYRNSFINEIVHRILEFI